MPAEPFHRRPEAFRRDKYVTSAVSESYLLAAAQHGMGEAEFLARSGLSRMDVEGRHGRVAGAVHLRTLQLFDDLGIVPLPQDGGFDDLNVLYPSLMTLLSNSATLREALRNFVHYQPKVMGTMDRFTMHEDTGRVMLLHDQVDTRAASNACVFGMFMFANNIATHYGDRSRMDIRIGLRGQVPAAGRSLASSAGGRIATDAARNTWVLAGELLDRPYEMHNRHAERYARQRLDHDFHELANAGSLAHRVAGMVLGFLRAPEDRPDDENLLAGICDSLGLSRWTLRRRLAAEGTSFSALLADGRRDEMCRLLEHPGLSIAEIGDRLGFSTPASLTRFAHDRLGMSPSDYRRRLAGAAPSFVTNGS